ncbi:MAG: TonB-dependent siderophore receptor [Luteimonas sp.]
MTVRQACPRSHPHRAALALAVSAVLVAGAAQAQSTTAGSASTTDLDRIVVIAPDYVPSGSMTATKSDVPLIETPQSISVVTRDQIDLLSVNDVQQAIRYTAGIVGENYGPDLRFDFLTLRGFTPKQYIDGLQAPITTTIFNVGLDLYGFQEVDVLKGPASVLYGNAPPGGIYNLTSRRADTTFGGEVGVRVGSDDYRQLHGTVTGALTDTLSGRVTALVRERGSQMDFVEANRTYIAPTFTWQIGEATQFTGLAYYQKDANTGDTNGYLPASGTLLGNPNGQLPRHRNLGEPDYNRYDRTQYGIGYDFSHAFSDTMRFQQNARWNSYEEAQKLVYSTGFQADQRTVNRSAYPYAEDVEGFAVDSRLSMHLGNERVQHTLLAGLDVRALENFARLGFAAAPPIDAYDPVYGAAPIVTPAMTNIFNNQRVQQAGLYLQDQIRIGRTVLTASGRFDKVELENRQTGVTTKQDEFTWRAGANYIFDNGVAPYVSYATSFEPILGTDTATGRAFEPSTATQVEAGVKFDARGFSDDVRLFATAALFRIDQENLVNVQSGQTPMFGRQIGEVRAQGGELEIVARVRDRLSFNGAYSYTDSEVVTDQGGFSTGDPLPTTPKHKLTGFVDYSFVDGPLAGFGAGFGARYLSESAGSLRSAFNTNVLYGKSTTLYDAIVRYDVDNWRFALNASNLFDKEYVGRCSAIANCIYGQGRQIMATVTMKL